MPHLLCLGLGYTAQALVRYLSRNQGGQNWTFAGTARELAGGSISIDPDLEVPILPFDGIDPNPEVRAGILNASHILHSVPPDGDGDPVYRALSGELAAARSLMWFGYLSTTGVYGDHQGGWVNEDTPRSPVGIRGERRLDAENSWLALWRQEQLPAHIFRLPGIYGPGRNQLESLKSGTARRIVKPGQVFSRIHVDDIANALAASMAKPNPGRAYNLCDDEAVPPQQVVTFAAELLGREAPPEIDFKTADLSPMARSFYTENKMVDNSRMKTELGVKLRFPTYRHGLKALLSEIENP